MSKPAPNAAFNQPSDPRVSVPTRFCFTVLSAILLVLVNGADTAAQQPQQEAATATGVSRRTAPALRAERRTSDVRIDGRLDEAAWSVAAVANDFTESYPQQHAPARFRTEARVLYDDDALYVALRMYDSAPDSVVSQLARRDATGIYSDWVQVMIDSYNDRRTAFSFGVNPRGVRRDVYLYNDASEDWGWDAVWEAEARTDSLGWTAEFRIPFSQLRFAGSEPEGGRTWGIQFTRDVARHQARYSWSPWVRSDNGFVSFFGSLTGIQGVRAPTQLELLPYAVARMRRAPAVSGDPFRGASTTSLSAGTDVRYGLPNGFTLNASINPDFGQVELDPAFVNLSAFEIQLPERRPFFVEGTDIFRFGNLLSYISLGSPQFFYSRRVGRAPQRNPGNDPDVIFHDTPQSTTILGAAKLTGKTRNGWSIGVLDAVTSREESRVERSGGERGVVAVEPLSNYLVSRLRKDMRGGRTVLGVIATATHRSQRDSVFSPLLRSHALTGGVDAEHSWADRMWAVSAFVAGSSVNGSAAAIAATQRSSARYYLRPDADYLEYDPTRTTLGGRVMGAALRKGGAWRGSVWMQEVSPGFEVNDLGFQGRTDTRSAAALFGYRRDNPQGPFRDWFVRGFTSQRWNFGGDHITENYSLRATGSLRNLWSGGATVERQTRTFDDRQTFGGPVTSRPGTWVVNGSISSDSRKRFSGGIDVGGYRGDLHDHGSFIYGFIQGRPASNVQFTVGPEFERNYSGAQFLRSRADDLATDTYGRRYLFAHLSQTTAALSTRLDWTMRPTLSLQLYARPLISAGDYERFGELEAPRTSRFAEYGVTSGSITRDRDCSGAEALNSYAIDPGGSGSEACFTLPNPDFNFRSLRGNAVLRWEYRPGSALFLVWQQQRAGQAQLGDFSGRRELGALFAAPPTNTILLKATYWLSY